MSDLQAMMKMGIISTPGVAVDGVLTVAGRVPKPEPAAADHYTIAVIPTQIPKLREIGVEL